MVIIMAHFRLISSPEITLLKYFLAEMFFLFIFRLFMAIIFITSPMQMEFVWLSFV